MALVGPPSAGELSSSSKASLPADSAKRWEMSDIVPYSTRNRMLPAEDLKSIHRTMLRIRAFEQRTAELFTEGLIKGTAHSYVGEEAIAAAVCANLRRDDIIGSYHRGHGHCIAKGADLRKMMAELMGRSSGYCGGLGGSMHIADLNLGILGANGIVGAAMPLCTGAALAAKLSGQGQVAVAFFGDGASNQGVFHESMNLAAVWKLPMLFVCENNQYALTTSYLSTTAGSSIADRALAYGVPGIQVNGLSQHLIGPSNPDMSHLLRRTLLPTLGALLSHDG